MKDIKKELKKRISDQLPYLTQAQKKVANFVIKHPEEFALCSVRDLEKLLDTSKSTIVRFVQRLGYEGFSQLKLAFLRNIRRDLAPVHRYKIMVSDSVEKTNHLNMICQETVDNINGTLPLADPVQFKKAVRWIKSAKHVYCAGIGISYHLAALSTYLLNRVSIQATAMNHLNLWFTEQIVTFSPKDILILFSLKPYGTETIDAAKFAKKKNLKVIAISDNPTSDIVPYSDIFFQVVVESMTISNSIVSPMVLMYAIISQIGFDMKDKIIENIEFTENTK